MDTKKVGVITLAIAVVAMLVAAFAVTAYPGCDLLNATEYTGANTLRVHGEDSFGPGDPSVVDPITGNAVEDLPYTESIAPFDPQHIQAPPKDSITFNPLLLSEFDNMDEFDDAFLGDIQTDDGDALEKVFWRQWYEPLHWDKDVDCNGLLTCEIYDGGDGMCDTLARVDDVNVGGVVPDDPVTPGALLITPGPNGVIDSVPGDIDGDGVADRTCCMDDRISCDPDEAYPAIMQEFTYMLLEGKAWATKPEPTHGQPGKTQIVFPVGMDEPDLDCGYGLTSLDANFDGIMDIVRVESELSLYKDLTLIAADFNGNDVIDPLDTDGQPLTGDELVVLTINPKRLHVGDKLQFLDHMVELVEVYNSDQVRLKVSYTGDVELSDGDTVTIRSEDMLMASGGSTQLIEAVSNGGDGTNICGEAMPWFAYIVDVNCPVDVSARHADIIVGRALGHAHTAMEENLLPDRTPDPWFVKRFYVDGHEYNVVAVETFGAGVGYFPDCNGDGDVDCPADGTLDCDGNGVIDDDPNMLDDDISEFKYITIRTPIPKEGEYKDGGIVPFYYIEQHSVRLEVYDELEYLSVMPPFNHEHVMVEDVQGEWSDPVLFLGPLQFNTEAITQTAAGDHIWYIEELKNPQFTGELLEKYNEIEERKAIPLCVVYGIDSSGSMGGSDPTNLRLKAAKDFTNKLDPTIDVAGVVSWDNGIDFSQPLTNDFTLVKNKIDQVDSSGGTNLNVGLSESISVMDDCTGDVEVIIFLSNGGGTYTNASAGGPASVAAGKGYLIYSIGLNVAPGSVAEAALMDMADATGGKYYPSLSADNLADIYDEIFREVLISMDEFWYAEQYNTKPDLYTEFVLPGGHGLYLLTSAFVAPSAQGQIVMQDEKYKLIINGNRVKFWFNPADGTKIYKDTDGLRVFGEYNRGPGDTKVGVDVLPYTDPVAVFNPQQPQSPRKDSITFDTAYMAEYIHTDEPLKAMYDDIKIEGLDAREKAYFRLWYEPDHWDMDGANGSVPDGKRQTEECYHAVMEEFTYIYLDLYDQPSHGAPGRNTEFAFPIATNWTDLWDSEGYGLNTFDYNFDGVEDVVMVYSEATLAARTGISADFDGDGVIQALDLGSHDELSGDEIVIFAVEIGLTEGASAMFLDHMITMDQVSSGPTSDVFLHYNHTGGGLLDFEPVGFAGGIGLSMGEMAILEGTTASFTKITAGSHNLGGLDGAWFVYVIAADDGTDSATLLIGRALGETHIAMNDPAWYMKRFYVDGHEYNVVAVKTVPDDEFKFITIRTPVPKEEFTIVPHSQDLEDYPICNNITVMPPYNYEHTVRADVRPGWTAPYHPLLPDLADMKYMGPKENRPPLEVHIRNETNEPRFYGELKEMYNRRPNVTVDAVVVSSNTAGGKANVGGTFYGTVDGRSMDGKFNFTITPKVACCDGDITGLWSATDASVDDQPPLYNDNNISDFDGVITGSYDYSEGTIEITWRRGDLDAELVDGYEIHHDYLCFWTKFAFNASLTCDPGLCQYTDVAYISSGFDGTYDVDFEEWMTEQFWTRPDQYTEFDLPTNHTYGDTTYDLYYLLTSSWYAPQAVWRTVNENNGGPYDITWYTGNRVKFWYNPATALDLFVNQDTQVNRDYITLVDQWDENGNGYMDLDEIVLAIMSYITTGGTTPTVDDLIELLVDYLMHS